MVQPLLDAVCDRVEGCQTVAFSDLSTKMVLVTNSACPMTRDALNLLCREAALCLETGTQAMVGTQTELRIFLRSQSEPQDALCCVCSATTDVQSLVAELGQCLEQLSGDEASG